MFVCMDIRTPEESFGSHRTRVIGGYESACGRWELNLGPEKRNFWLFSHFERWNLVKQAYSYNHTEINIAKASGR